MSRMTAVVVLEKLKHTPASEDFEFHNIECPNCQGEGGYNEEIGREQYNWVDCERCKGAGKFSVKVEVEWIPDFN